MATVTHTFFLPDGTAQKGLTVIFRTYGGPWMRASGTTSSSRISSTTNAATGVLSQTLLQGIYSVNWRSGVANDWSSYFIGVPSGDSSYTLDQLVYDPSASADVSSGFSYFETLAAMRLDISNSRLAFLNSNANGDFGWYAAAGDTGADDGVNFVWNANGVVYTRKS